MSLMICRGHIRASNGTFQIFLWLTVLWQIDILVQFALWSSFQVEFERVISGLGGQKIILIVNLNMVYQIPV